MEDTMRPAPASVPRKLYMQYSVQQLRRTAVWGMGIILLLAGATASHGQLRAASPVSSGSTICGAQLLSGFGFANNREAYQVLQGVIDAAGRLPQLSGLSANHFDTRA